MSKPRDHHLRERRLKLGISQYELGQVAGIRGFRSRSYHSVQSPVSNAELHNKPACTVKKLREALVYLESEKRRKREWERRDRIELERLKAMATAGSCSPLFCGERIIGQMVDLLRDGRGDDFDLVAQSLPEHIVKQAGDLYLDGVTTYRVMS